MLLADRKARVRAGVARKGKRERDLDGRAVRAPALAFEAHCRRGRDAGAGKLRGVARRIAALQQQGPKALVLAEKIAARRAEQARKRVAPELFGLRDGQELDEEAGKLDQPVVRAPRMAVARATREAEPLVGRGPRVEIADRMNDMVEAARHAVGFRVQRTHI